MGMQLTSTGAWAQNGNDDERVKIGFAVAPVPLNLAGKTPAQILNVGLGS